MEPFILKRVYTDQLWFSMGLHSLTSHIQSYSYQMLCLDLDKTHSQDPKPLHLKYLIMRVQNHTHKDCLNFHHQTNLDQHWRNITQIYFLLLSDLTNKIDVSILALRICYKNKYETFVKAVTVVDPLTRGNIAWCKTVLEWTKKSLTCFTSHGN